MHSLFEELEKEILRGRGECPFGKAFGKIVMAFKLGAISREARIIVLVDELVRTRVDDWRSSTMRVLCIEAGFLDEWLNSCSLETDRELTFKAAERLGYSLN